MSNETSYSIEADLDKPNEKEHQFNQELPKDNYQAVLESDNKLNLDDGSDIEGDITQGSLTGQNTESIRNRSKNSIQMKNSKIKGNISQGDIKHK